MVGKKGEHWSSFVFMSLMLMAMLGVVMMGFEDVSVTGHASMSELEKSTLGVILGIFVIFALVITVVSKIVKSRHHEDVSASLSKVNAELGRMEHEVVDLDNKLR